MKKAAKHNRDFILKPSRKSGIFLRNALQNIFINGMLVRIFFLLQNNKKLLYYYIKHLYLMQLYVKRIFEEEAKIFLAINQQGFLNAANTTGKEDLSYKNLRRAYLRRCKKQYIENKQGGLFRKYLEKKKRLKKPFPLFLANKKEKSPLVERQSAFCSTEEEGIYSKFRKRAFRRQKRLLFWLKALHRENTRLDVFFPRDSFKGHEFGLIPHNLLHSKLEKTVARFLSLGKAYRGCLEKKITANKSGKVYKKKKRQFEERKLYLEEENKLQIFPRGRRHVFSELRLLSIELQKFLWRLCRKTNSKLLIACSSAKIHTSIVLLEQILNAALTTDLVFCIKIKEKASSKKNNFYEKKIQQKSRKYSHLMMTMASLLVLNSSSYLQHPSESGEMHEKLKKKVTMKFPKENYFEDFKPEDKSHIAKTQAKEPEIAGPTLLSSGRCEGTTCITFHELSSEGYKHTVSCRSNEKHGIGNPIGAKKDTYSYPKNKQKNKPNFSRDKHSRLTWGLTEKYLENPNSKSNDMPDDHTDTCFINGSLDKGNKYSQRKKTPCRMPPGLPNKTKDRSRPSTHPVCPSFGRRTHDTSKAKLACLASPSFLTFTPRRDHLSSLFATPFPIFLASSNASITSQSNRSKEKATFDFLEHEEYTDESLKQAFQPLELPPRGLEFELSPYGYEHCCVLEQGTHGGIHLVRMLSKQSITREEETSNITSCKEAEKPPAKSIQSSQLQEAFGPGKTPQNRGYCVAKMIDIVEFPSIAERELNCMSMVSGHPHIVQCYESIEILTLCIIIMEYCERGDLLSIIQKQRQKVELMNPQVYSGDKTAKNKAYEGYKANQKTLGGCCKGVAIPSHLRIITPGRDGGGVSGKIKGKEKDEAARSFMKSKSYLYYFLLRSWRGHGGVLDCVRALSSKILKKKIGVRKEWGWVNYGDENLDGNNKEDSAEKQGYASHWKNDDQRITLNRRKYSKNTVSMSFGSLFRQKIALLSSNKQAAREILRKKLLLWPFQSKRDKLSQQLEMEATFSLHSSSRQDAIFSRKKKSVRRQFRDFGLPKASCLWFWGKLKSASKGLGCDHVCGCRFRYAKLVVNSVDDDGNCLLGNQHDECLREGVKKRQHTRQEPSMEMLEKEKPALYTGGLPHNGVLELAADSSSYIVNQGNADKPFDLHPEGHFSEGQILKWFEQLLQGLSHIHSKNIVHCDLKTANIFVTAQGDLKLGDFGISINLNGEYQQEANGMELHMKTSVPIGTLPYMSPEMCKKMLISKKSDCWALGCVLFEMAAFTPPFQARKVEELLDAIKRDSINIEQRIPSFYSDKIRLLIKRLLVQDVDARASLDDIRKILKEA